MRTLVIFPGPEPQWNAAPELLRSRLPQADFRFATGLAEAAPHIGDAEVALTFYLSDELARRATRLRWIQTLGAGVDGVIDLPSLSPKVLISTVSGMNAPAVAEAALAAMLTRYRRIADGVHNQDARQWQPIVSRLLTGKTAGIVGLGRIGSALAVRCRALGMRVVGFSAQSGERPDFDAVYARDALPERVGECDVLVLCAALTPQTRRVADARVLAAMKPTAILINVGRGDLLDEAALAAALREDRLGGAALDVFATEPLPADHPFWADPRVTVTAHSAGRYDGYVTDAVAIFATNMTAFAAGNLDGMINVVRRPAEATA